jgi:hypothetical protein
VIASPKLRGRLASTLQTRPRRALVWMLGFALHVTLGGLLHLLLVLAIISVLVRIIMGRRIA